MGYSAWWNGRSIVGANRGKFMGCLMRKFWARPKPSAVISLQKVKTLEKPIWPRRTIARPMLPVPLPFGFGKFPERPPVPPSFGWSRPAVLRPKVFPSARSVVYALSERYPGLTF